MLKDATCRVAAIAAAHERCWRVLLDSVQFKVSSSGPHTAIVEHETSLLRMRTIRTCAQVLPVVFSVYPLSVLPGHALACGATCGSSAAQARTKKSWSSSRFQTHEVLFVCMAACLFRSFLCNIVVGASSCTEYGQGVSERASMPSCRRKIDPASL